MHVDGDWQTVEGVLSQDMATVGEYLQTWKRKLKVLQKQCWKSFTSTTRKLSVIWKSTTTTKPCPFAPSPRPQIPRDKVGQGTHVPPTARVTSKKVDITRCTLEAGYWLWLGCWSNNVANSQLSPGPFNSRVLRSCLVPQWLHPPHWPCHQRRLANCDWMPAPYTSRRPTCWSFVVKEPHYLWHAVPGRLDISVGMQGILNRDTHLYPLHNNSSVHVTTITEVQRSERITDGLWKGWRTRQNAVL